MNQRDITLEKSMPHSMDAERAVLGGILIHPPAFTQVIEMLTPEDFYFSGHQRIFTAMQDIWRGGGEIDSLTVCHVLATDKHLEEIGGVPYVTSLMDGCPRVDNLVTYAEFVREKSRMRRVIHLANETLIRGFADEEPAEQLIGRMQSELFALSADRAKKTLFFEAEIAPENYRQILEAHEAGKPRGLQTTWGILNRQTGGVQRGQQWIVAGRPSLGKTALSIDWFDFWASTGAKVLMFSLETGREVIHSRTWSKLSKIPASKLINTPYQLTKEELAFLESSIEHVSRRNLMICDDANVTTDDVLLKAMEAQQQMGGLDVIVLDYLQLLDLPHWMARKATNRTEHVSEVSRQLKRNVVRRLNVPLIALTMVKRMVNEDAPPDLPDLRESGQIEADADVVLMLHRRRMTDRKDSNDPDDFEYEAWLRKNKNGPTGFIPLVYRKQTMRFEERVNPDLPL